jgi:hypothetical protein
MNESAIEYVRSAVLPAALSMLPPHMDSIEARAMLLAIGMQESRFKYRRQMRGPALSFWQAEATGGFRGLSTIRPRRARAWRAQAHGVRRTGSRDFQALEDNDILACIGARLLLWTHPKALPEGDASAAWHHYIDVLAPRQAASRDVGCLLSRRLGA